MTDPIDAGLGRLRRAHSDDMLDGLESAVWARVEKGSQTDIFAGHMIRAQIAVTAVALILGFVVADFAGSDVPRVQSELSVLSDDIAPSILLEGGA